MCTVIQSHQLSSEQGFSREVSKKCLDKLRERPGVGLAMLKIQKEQRRIVCMQKRRGEYSCWLLNNGVLCIFLGPLSFSRNFVAKNNWEGLWKVCVMKDKQDSTRKACISLWKVLEGNGRIVGKARYSGAMVSHRSEDHTSD